MDITNENFVRKLPEISETIQKCDFIAIDTELSGLMRQRSLNRFDLPEERFAKSVESSRGYFIMQFGLSCFTRTDDLKYSNRSYNFYIFPQPHKFHGDVNRTFSLQAHAIQFLTEHGFDFNKLFKHGVSYLTFQEKKLLTAQLKSDSKARSKVEFGSQGLPKFVPNQLATYCCEWIKKIDKFAEKRKSANRDSSPDMNNESTFGTSNGDDPGSDMNDDLTLPAEDRLDLRDCTTQHKRFNMKRVLECLPISDNLLVNEVTDADTNETYLTVHYVDKRTKTEKLKRALIVAKGFLEIIELIIVNKKPIVGHNLSLDLIQIINQFMEPLSDDYNTFKETCHSLLPLIYDTKYIAHSILDPKTLTQNQSRLYDLYCQLKDNDSFPKIKVEHLGVFFDENQLPHQAGYDAYMSGYCFIVLCEAHLRYNISKKNKHSKVDVSSDAKPPPLSTHQQVVSDFSNKIHLSYSYDFKYFDLCREEEEPDRSHVFYVEHPDTWTLDDLFLLFHQHGGVEACKLNRHSALCALRDPKQTSAVEKKAEGLTRSNYKIYSYEKYLENYRRTKRKSTGGDDEDGDVVFSDL